MHKVCIDARLIHAPGIGTYLKNLFPYFQSAALQWCALVDPKHVDQLPPFLQPVSLRAPIYSLREQAALPLKIPRVDLFWSPHYNVPCLPIRAKKRLVTIHDAFHLAWKKRLSPLQRVYAQKMMHSALKLSAQILTPSHFSKSEIQRYTGMLNRPITVIPCGVDTHYFSQPLDEQETRKVLQKYQIKSPFLLYVGSSKPHKNVKTLIEAFLALGTQAVQLVLIGPGQDGVHSIGFVPQEELVHFYRAAKIFIFPSFYEGFGLPPLEAMTAGCPTLVSQAGALPEVCGEGALYFDPHKPEELTKLLAHLLSDEKERQALAERGRKRSRHFCWQRCAQHHIDIMEKILR